MPDFLNEIENIFAADGSLSSLEGFEYRKPQQDMAIRVAQSLENNSHLIIEAPTGVGKSFAYLGSFNHFFSQRKTESSDFYMHNQPSGTTD